MDMYIKVEKIISGVSTRSQTGPLNLEKQFKNNNNFFIAVISWNNDKYNQASILVFSACSCPLLAEWTLLL